jgi:hypothetical protein
MEIKNSAKEFVYRNFDLFEIRSTNFLLKTYITWKVKHRYLLHTDSMPPTYKKEVLQYWNKYTKKIKLHWHKFYSSRNGIYDVRYIPDDLFYTIVDQHFNNRKYSWGIMDKNYFSLWFSEVKQPMIVIRKINGILYDDLYNIISLQDAFNMCLENEQLIIKPAVRTGGSKGINFWDKKDGLKKIENYLLSGLDDYIFQKLIVQHVNLKKIHSSSINTIRVVTLLFKGKVHILSSVLRMGVNGSRVDNASVGGITCGIKEGGQLKDVAYSVSGIKYEKHPQGFTFSDCIIPSYDKIKKLVIKQQEKMANFRMISWDIAVDEEEQPILIEANIRLGDVGIHQLNNGPIFGELTDEVLEEVFCRK